MSRAEAVSMALIGLAAVMFVWLAAPIWTWVGGIWRFVLVLLLALALWRLARRAAPRPWMPARRARLLLPAIVFSALAFENGLALAGRTTSEAAVELEWPLRDGSFVILHGGSTAVLNNHHGMPAQRYALDVVAVDRFGRRASGLLPAQLDRYRIFGMPVHAPCDGEVISARDGIEDAAGQSVDPSALAGNYAAIYCPGHTILLAHLESGTLAVKPGERVAAGQLLGLAGSSGNSSEPHLHMHANAGRVDDPVAMITTARGVPMRFSGRFLVRNDVVRH
jgi:murein DD-endopeptidase MepM/ murein hydrolase activator NlpD